MIYSDDQSFDEFGAYGGKVLTPSMDRLAREGIKFMQGWALLTGQYASRSRDLLTEFPPGGPVNIGWNTYLIDGDVTMPMALKDHGYFTGVVGKWHLGAPRLIYPGDASPHYQDYEFLERQNNLTLQHCKDFGFDVAERVYRSNVGAVEVNNDIPWELKFHNLEWVTGGATSFLDQAKATDKPWFLYYSFTAPHGPPTRFSLNNPAYVTPLGIMYEGMTQEEWPQEHLQPRSTVYERALAAGITDPDFQAITWMDDALETLMAKVDDLGMRKTTMTIYISDHQADIIGKGTCYYAANVPFIVHWPTVIQPSSNDLLVMSLDIFPTLLDYAGVEPSRLVPPPAPSPSVRYLECGKWQGCSEESKFANPLEIHDVRCCSDVEIAGWTKRENFGCDIWSESDGPAFTPDRLRDSTCQRAKTFFEAEVICADAGGRLCTAAELQSDCAFGTGCALDDKLIWTSDEGVAPAPPPAPLGLQLDGKSLRPILEGYEFSHNGRAAPWQWRAYLYLEVFWTRAVVSFSGWKYLAKRFPPDVQALADEGIPLDHQGYWPGHNQYLRLFKGKLPEHYPHYLDDDQLYKLPDETVNLWDSSMWVAKQAKARMQQFMAEVSATLPHTFGEFTS